MASSQNLVPEMVHIEAGAFWMGALDWNKVYLDEYWISKYPVTEGQFTRLFEQFGNTKAKKKKPLRSRWVSKALHPVTGVSWEEAMEYCRCLSLVTGQRFGLSSEAQWEKAARGADGRMYP